MWKARKVVLDLEKEKEGKAKRARAVAPLFVTNVVLEKNVIHVVVPLLLWKPAFGVVRMATLPQIALFLDLQRIHLRSDLRLHRLWSPWQLAWKPVWWFSKMSMAMNVLTARCLTQGHLHFFVDMALCVATWGIWSSWDTPLRRSSLWSVVGPFTLVVMLHRWALGLWSFRCSSTRKLEGSKPIWWKARHLCCLDDPLWNPWVSWWTFMGSVSSSWMVSGNLRLVVAMENTFFLWPVITSLEPQWMVWTSTWWFLMMMSPQPIEWWTTQTSGLRRLPMRPLIFPVKYLRVNLVTDLYDVINFEQWKFPCRLQRRLSMQMSLRLCIPWLERGCFGRSTVVAHPESLRWPRPMAWQLRDLV